MRLPRQAPDDVPDTYFFGYNEDEGEAPLHLRHPPTPPMSAETASPSRAIEGEMVAVEDTEPRETEILEKGVLASRGIDFVFRNWQYWRPIFFTVT